MKHLTIFKYKEKNITGLCINIGSILLFLFKIKILNYLVYRTNVCILISRTNVLSKSVTQVTFFKEYKISDMDMSVGTLVAVIATFKTDEITPCVLDLKVRKEL